MYFKSALRGNAFGLCRLGSLCIDKLLPRSLLSITQLQDMLTLLNSSSESQHLRNKNEFLTSINEERNSTFRAVAKGLWFEAAMRGDLFAQLYLADACMEDFMSSSRSRTEVELDEKETCRNQEEILTASVLFAMAAQQGDEGALESLSRLMGIHRSFYPSDDELFDEETFLNSPISKTIMVGADLVAIG